MAKPAQAATPLGQHKTFGQILFARRKQLGMTQSQVAGEIGVQPNYIVYLEKNERKPSAKTVRKVADALGLDRATLYLAANPQVREFLTINQHGEVERDEIPEGLRMLMGENPTAKAMRNLLSISEEELMRLQGVGFTDRSTNIVQFVVLILVMRYIFR